MKKMADNTKIIGHMLKGKTSFDANEAKSRRKKLERESQYFGSMDGANKFVKGDAIAGIIILIINIIGGLLIGRFMQGLSFGDAVTIFTTLSIGDGLVAQVPALLIAIASGLVVTKSDFLNFNLVKNNFMVFNNNKIRTPLF